LLRMGTVSVLEIGGGAEWKTWTTPDGIVLGSTRTRDVFGRVSAIRNGRIRVTAASTVRAYRRRPRIPPPTGSQPGGDLPGVDPTARRRSMRWRGPVGIALTSLERASADQLEPKP
jgi:hypothetical protein